MEIRPAGFRSATAATFNDARRRQAGGEHRAALLAYLQLLDSSAADLVESPTEPGLYVPVGRLCQEQLLTLPPDMLGAYRMLSDSRAERWRKAGEESADPRSLWRIHDEALASSPAVAALDALGTMLLEAGLPAEAEAIWEKAASLPQPPVDAPSQAHLRAHALLARLHRPGRPGLDDGLHRFAARHPQAHGRIAGREGCYADILRELAAARPLETHAKPPPALRGEAPLPEAAWSVAIEPPLPHPPALVSAGGYVLFSDGRRLVAIELTHGAAATWRQVEQAEAATQPYPPAPAAQRELVYVSLGRELVCFDAAKKGLVVWKTRLPLPHAGTPLATPTRVFVGLCRREPDALVALACYRADSGEQLWYTELARRAAPVHMDTMRLAFSGRYVVFATPLGLVAAVDPDTGRPGWVVVPPRDTADAEAAVPEPRGAELPLLAHDGDVLVAPRGSARLCCYDGATGRLRWETPRLIVEQILGVVNETVLLHTPRGLLALERGTGAPRWRFASSGLLHAPARPLHISNMLLWPTNRGWQAIDGATGKLHGEVASPIVLPLGYPHLAGGRLLLSSAQRILSFPLQGR